MRNIYKYQIQIQFCLIQCNVMDYKVIQVAIVQQQLVVHIIEDNTTDKVIDPKRFMIYCNLILTVLKILYTILNYPLKSEFTFAYNEFLLSIFGILQIQSTKYKIFWKNNN